MTLNKRIWLGGLVVFLLASLSSMVWSLINPVPYPPGEGHIGFNPAGGEVAPGETFSVVVKASVPDPVNTVQFKASYPADKLQVTAVTSLLPLEWERDISLKLIDFSQPGTVSFFHFAGISDKLLEAGVHDLARITFRVSGGAVGEPAFLVRLSEGSLMNEQGRDVIVRLDGPATYTLAADRCVIGEELVNANTCSPAQPLFCTAQAQRVNNCQQCGCPDQQVCQRDGSCRAPVQQACDLLVRQNMKLESDIGSANNGCPDNGVTIAADNVVFDCDGHTIYGSGLHNGIYINRRNSVLVKNCNVVHFNRGIAVEQSSQVTIRNINANGNNDFGIHLRGSSLNTIIGSTVTGNGQGILIDTSSDRNTLEGNTIADNFLTNDRGVERFGNGITVQSSLGNTLRNNQIRNNLFGIFLRLANSNTVEDNVVERNKRHGIDLVLADSNTLESNVVQDNDADSDGLGDGIRLLSSRFNTLVDNRVINTRGNAFGNRVGIRLEDGSTDNRLEDNVVNRNKEKGIFVQSSNNNRVQHNVACDNEGRDFFCDDQSTRIAGRENTFGDAQEDENGDPLKVMACSDGFPRKNTDYQFCFLQAEDGDEDGIRDEEDNCPLVFCQETLDLEDDDAKAVCANPLQRDPDRDGFGDPCDGDNDNDGVCEDTVMRGTACAAGPEPLACRQTANGREKNEQNLVQQGVCDLTRESCRGCLIGDFSGRVGDLGPDAPDGCVNNNDVSYVTTHAAELLDRLTARGFTQLLFALHANYNQQCVPPAVS